MYLFTIIHRLRCFRPCLFLAPEINFHSGRIGLCYEKPAPKACARKINVESIYGAGFWSVCHGYNVN